MKAAKPDFTGKVTVSVLWDKKNRTIVNAGSIDIIRMFNSDFDAFVDFYPEPLRGEIDSLNKLILDDRLSNRDFLIGQRVTESDWHLFMTLVRFDAVYHTKLKCSRKCLVDHANLSRYTQRLYRLPGVAETTKLNHVKMHYFDDLGIGDPRIIPADPDVDFRNSAYG